MHILCIFDVQMFSRLARYSLAIEEGVNGARVVTWKVEDSQRQIISQDLTYCWWCLEKNHRVAKNHPKGCFVFFCRVVSREFLKVGYSLPNLVQDFWIRKSIKLSLILRSNLGGLWNVSNFSASFPKMLVFFFKLQDGWKENSPNLSSRSSWKVPTGHRSPKSRSRR